MSNAGLDVDLLSVQDILEQTKNLLGLADAGLITIFDEQRGSDEVIAAFNHDLVNLSNINIKSGQGATGWVYKHNEPRLWTGSEDVEAILDNVETSSRKALLDSSIDGGRKSLMCSPLEIHGKAFGAIQIEHFTDDRQFSELDLQILTHLVADPLALALETSGIVQTIRSDNAKMRGLLHKVIRAREEERERIARDLHDNIAQTLASLHIAVLNFQRLANKMPEQSDLMEYLKALDDDIQYTVNVTQNLVLDLRPALLDDYGLVGALTWYLTERVGVDGAITTRITTTEVNFEDLSEDISTTLFRVAQEALSNVLRHAQAKSVEVNLLRLDNLIILTIHDDGKGFVLGETDKLNGNLGIKGMSERLSMVDGSIKVESKPGHGTTVEFSIPLEEQANDKSSVN